MPAADPPGTLRSWAWGERLPTGVHDIWCRPGPSAPWRVQVIGTTIGDGIRYLTPEIQLYYKAKNPHSKDEIDFTTILPLLATTQRRWLSDAIAHTFGEHPWRDRLSNAEASDQEPTERQGHC